MTTVFLNWMGVFYFMIFFMDFQLKVVSILSQVQESCSSEEAKLLDKVMEFLKREGLYSPQVKDMRTDDPVATDLIGALLTVIN